MSWPKISVLCVTAALCSFLIGGRYTVDASGDRAYITDRFTGGTVFCANYRCFKTRREPTPD